TRNVSCEALISPSGSPNQTSVPVSRSTQSTTACSGFSTFLMRLVYGRMSYSRHTCPACAGREGSWVVAVVACADAQGAVPDRAPRNSRTLVRQTAARIRQLHLSFSSCNSGLPVPVLADHDGRIVPAEAKAVAHRVADCA